VLANPLTNATIVVIGAGQAGLSAAYHLSRRGFVSALREPGAAKTFVVLDAETRAGGAWQHRWPSLTMKTVNGIFDLPGFPLPPIDPSESSRDAVPRYFAAYEKAFGFPILRPIHVSSVRRADDTPHHRFIVDTDQGSWLADAVINATGTWTNPVLPDYPGADRFAGRQLHTSQYGSAEEFAGHRVAIVGGGISAVQQLEEISRFATTFWYTRREPVFLDHDFEPETTGRDTIERVTADAEAGKPTGSIVSYTGLGWSPYAIAARDRGVLERRPMFTRIERTACGRPTARSPPSMSSCGRPDFGPRSRTWIRSASAIPWAGSKCAARGSCENRDSTSSASAHRSRQWAPTAPGGPRSAKF
jgi:cation diffusion facilitator CzcD-associated flavoprotein CzcO